jgi:hypothetical protein
VNVSTAQPSRFIDVIVPESYKAFLKLRRFRTALLLDTAGNKKQAEKLIEFACNLSWPAAW